MWNLRDFTVFIRTVAEAAKFGLLMQQVIIE